MTINQKTFKDTLKLWASGVTVITAQTAKHGLKGMTATSFSSVSLEPPQILVCINKATGTSGGLLDGKSFAVNILTAAQRDVSACFASNMSQQERFSSITWHEGATGSPIIDDALASIECTIVQQVLAGTHWVIIGEVQHTICQDGDPLLYYNCDYRTLKT